MSACPSLSSCVCLCLYVCLSLSVSASLFLSQVNVRLSTFPFILRYTNKYILYKLEQKTPMVLTLLIKMKSEVLMYTRKVLIPSFKFVLVEPAESIDNFSGAFINTRKGLSPKSQFLKNKNSFFFWGGGGQIAILTEYLFRETPNVIRIIYI